MAAPAAGESHVNNHVGGFEDEEDDLEDTEDSDMEEGEEEYEDDFAATPVPIVTLPSSATNPNPPPPPPPPLGQYNGSIVIQHLSSSPKEKRPPATLALPAPQPPASLEDSRRLFQRLWTDDDEIKILNGFLEFTSSRGTTFASHQYDTGPFYEQIKNQLQLDFSKNQLIEKLRRLKKKYRNTASRMASHGRDFSFKSPHESATYEIARRIWSAGSSVKRNRDDDDDDDGDLNPYANSNSGDAATAERRTARTRRRGRKRALEKIPPQQQMPPARPILVPPPVLAGPAEGVVKVEVQMAPAKTILPMPSAAAAVPSIVGEAVKSCLSPIFKELLNSMASVPIGPGLDGLNGGLGLLGPPPEFGFRGNSMNSSSTAAAVDERWKQQWILELEVYLKRVELVRDQIKSTLEELKSSELTAVAVAPAPNAGI